jgi:hypothetical protein
MLTLIGYPELSQPVTEFLTNKTPEYVPVAAVVDMLKEISSGGIGGGIGGSGGSEVNGKS